MGEHFISQFSPKAPMSFDKTKKESLERKRNILHLIHSYLIENNLENSAEALQHEALLNNQVQVCENVDLDIILQEYFSYYYTKFQRYPKIVRKVNELSIKKSEKKLNSAKSNSKTVKSVENKLGNKQPLVGNEEFQFEIIKLDESKSVDSSIYKVDEDQNVLINPFTDLVNNCNEVKEMAHQIIRDVIPKNRDISFEDCVGLKTVIERLKEGTIYPILFPKLFENIPPWKGVLLYGPPGTGKTLLAKALNNETRTNFISVASSTFISKWRGDSEKLIKTLFEITKHNSPCTVFIDELDSIALSNAESQHEASVRFKGELLSQIDGIKSNNSIFILATTNSPWKIDTAMLRRFEKRILVNLPNNTERKNLFIYHLKKMGVTLKDDEAEFLGNKTELFSGSDIRVVCKEAVMGVVREKLSASYCRISKDSNLRNLTVEDVLKAVENIKPCVSKEEYKKYEEWGKQFGSI